MTDQRSPQKQVIYLMSTITDNIELAIQSLRQSDVVAIPTETVYGLAGNAENETAVKKIFTLKNRPLTHPLIVHVAKDCDLTRWVLSMPDYAQKLMDTFWPGPLTMVFNLKPGSISPLVNGGQNTIAIRCPQHPVAQSLLRALDFPLVAPSANPFGKISPTTSAHVQQSFQNQSLLILEGGRCGVGIESTIIDATHPDSWQILRHGMLNEQAIADILPGKQHTHPSAIRVPGRLDNHYQPEKPLYCFETRENLLKFCHINSSIYIMSFTKNSDFDKLPGYELPGNPDQFAYELYYQLRLADNSPASAIAIEMPPEQEKWEGIRERLLKAATKSPLK
jgi:L-threonylcarbamoyladenylate synthase